MSKKAPSTIFCEFGFKYGTTRFGFFMQLCIKIDDTEGRHQIVPFIKGGEENNPGYQVSARTWIPYWIIKAAMQFPIKEEVNITDMDPDFIQQLLPKIELFQQKLKEKTDKAAKK